MNNKSCIYNVMFALGMASCLNLASAQTLTSFKTSENRVPLNTPITALVEFQGADRNWCGFYIDWGDGKEPQSFRIGRKPDLASPVSRQRSFDKPGIYTLKAYGGFVSKGLQSAEKCEGTLQPVTITVYDSAEDDSKKVQEARTRELERKLKEAEAEAAKTLEQKAKEVKVDAEARSSAEAKVVTEAKAAAEVRAAEKATAGERAAAKSQAAPEGQSSSLTRAQNVDTSQTSLEEDKVYVFVRSDSGASGTCAIAHLDPSKKFDYQKNARYLGAFLKFHHKGTSLDSERPITKLTDDDIRSIEQGYRTIPPSELGAMLRPCLKIFATAEDLLKAPLLKKIIESPAWNPRESRWNRSSYAIQGSMPIQAAESVFIEAMGYQDMQTYRNAGSINLLLRGEFYNKYLQIDIKNIEDVNKIVARMDSNGCRELYGMNAEGFGSFIADQQRAEKSKIPMKNWCASQISKRNADLRKAELASPLLNCAKVNCQSIAAIESALRNVWLSLRGTPYADGCFQSLKSLTEWKKAGARDGDLGTEKTAEQWFNACNHGLKNR